MPTLRPAPRPAARPAAALFATALVPVAHAAHAVSVEHVPRIELWAQQYGPHPVAFVLVLVGVALLLSIVATLILAFEYIGKPLAARWQARNEGYMRLDSRKHK
ncbi:hypothetical protein MBRA1_003159 [Malassezia brasiliensis]|uniref:Uncharacterized protein n=1 Tax=Malassezia brasiliensis TaxID=1821822 RepID=A0AAF0IU25_9BASI|nr:hypothetical protein MBRA1_003159 [Malassezia brasiliensis]